MDIKHLNYFVGIVQNEFNLSRTADTLYISQPTLSVAIKRFEEERNVILFNRNNRRIIGLTEKGEQYYEDALIVLEKYNEMNKNLHQENNRIVGEITLGIPPGFISFIFPELVFNLIQNNPEIHFNFKERGAIALGELLVLNNVDIAFLIQPTFLTSNIIESYKVKESELALLISNDHPLKDKEEIEWDDLHELDMVMLDKTFQITQLVEERCSLYNVFPNVIFHAPSWDFLIEIINKNSNLATILQYPLLEHASYNKCTIKRFKNPIPWIATINRLKKNNYSKLENTVFNLLLEIIK